MLICRLNGEDPEDVYDPDVELMQLYLFGLILWPIVLLCELLYFGYQAIKKWLVLAIETIVAVKESKDEESED